MKRTAAIVALVGVLLLGGCSWGGQGTPAGDGSPTSAPEGTAPDDGATDAGDEDLVDEDTRPQGHCGDAPDDFKDQKFYQGSPETDCDDGFAMLEALAAGEGDDSAHVDGHGTDVDGWSCLYPMDDEIERYDLLMVCEKDEQKVFLRPASLEVPAGYHVQPWDYLGTSELSYPAIYFTTESRKHHCSFRDDELGCDNHNFPDDLPTVTYMGQVQQPTAIMITSSGEAKFAAFGDPTFTQHSESGGFGADTNTVQLRTRTA